MLGAIPEKIDGSPVSDSASMLYHIATSVDETVEPIPKPQVEPSKIKLADIPAAKQNQYIIVGSKSSVPFKYGES